MRASRASIARQPSVSRSTSRPRSSTRAFRSDSIAPSSRSSLRIALFERPFTSARRREIGAASSRQARRHRLADLTVLSSTTRRSYRPHRMESRELDYDLPPELIAQHPADRRDESRLLVFDRATGEVQHRVFRDLPELLPRRRSPSSTTRASCRRGSRSSSPRGEVLLLERVDGDVWEALARPTRRLRAGRELRPGRAARASGRGALARPARRRAGRAGAAAAVHHRAARRSRALPDRLRARAGLGCGADGRAALHGRAARAARRRASDAARRARHVPAAAGRRRVEEHRIHGERYEVTPAAWRAHRRRASGARGRHDDGARPRDGGARRRRSRGAPSSSSRPASSSAASTTC